MHKALLLSSAYSWFVGLLVLMVVMAVLFVVIALFALKPYKIDNVTNDSAAAIKLLEVREAELAAQLLNNKDDAEITEQLRQVSTAKTVVMQLLEKENGIQAASETALGYDSGLTEEEAASLESGEKETIERTFESREQEGLKKSFSAQLIQASDEVKVWYFELKNCILCYEKTKARMHWNNEKFYIGRSNVASLTVRGKQLCLYLAVNAEDYSEFPVKASTSALYKDITPCLFRIKNEKSVKKAKELIGLMMADYGVMYVRTNHSIYALPYEDDDALIARGLARKVDDDK